MRALLVSTYDLGRQPFGLASPAAWLRRAGIETACVDTSRERLTDQQIADASIVAFYLPMHTATRLAGPLITRTRRLNPGAMLAAYGLYAPLNRDWLTERGVTHVLGPESEAELVEIAANAKAQGPGLEAQGPTSRTQGTDSAARGIARLTLIQPDRAGLPPLQRYAGLVMPDGSTRVVGSTDATRGCKHLCRHCPIVPVYNGQFRTVAVDVVMDDIAAQVAAGAQHISFGDPDFFNGPAHARRILDRFRTAHPGVTYDATIKIEHLLSHADMLPLLAATGCLFITSAVESIDDEVLAHLRKGHTRADFLEAVALTRAAGLTLSPTFVPFTPWTTVEGYVELLDLLDEEDLVDQVAPIQLVIRLLVTSGSPLLELPDIAASVSAFDPASLTWPWRHTDARVDALQDAAMRLVGAGVGSSRAETFHALAALARQHAGVPPMKVARRASRSVAYLDEPWYCCAEPAADDLKFI